MSPEQLHQRKTPRVHIDGIHPKPVFDPSGSKIAVIGLDRAGLSLCVHAASRGLDVVGFDADEVKVAQLEGKSPDVLGKNARTLSITSDDSALKGADIFILCASGKEELGEAAALAARHISEGTLVVVSSDTGPGTCEHVMLPLLEKTSGISRRNIFFACAPKRRAERTHVIGASEEESLSRAVALYRYLYDAEVLALHSLVEAEAVPMLEEAFYDANLALADEFAVLFDRIGLDLSNSLRAAAPEIRRFFPILAGIDTGKSSSEARYFARSGHSHELERQFLSGARRVITRMPGYAVKLLSDTLRAKKTALKGARVALLWSQSRAPETEEAAAAILAALEKKGAVVRTFDPRASDQGNELKRVLKGASAVIVASNDPVFENLTPRQFEELGISVVVDACNCLDKAAFKNSTVAYRGIGRG